MILLCATALVASTTAQAQSVQGPWVEARAGWDHSSSDGESASGLLYGAAVGYDFAVGGKGFIGAQAGISGSTLDACADDGIDEICAKAGRDIEVLARGGFMVAERTALYALAGYANGRVSAEVVGFERIGTNFGGYRLGAGVEQQFGSGTYAKLEYRFTDYGNASLVGINIGDAGNRHQVSGSFGIRF
jgi:outer membrane immunogenic protein